MPYANHAGIRIHYQVEGEGPPIILQHGYTDSLGAWYQFGYVDGLKDGYRLIMIDARGHGASDKPHDPAAYDYALRAGDITAVLDDLNLRQAHYLGYSMGGSIGFHLAKHVPERISSLMIGGAHPYAVDDSARRVQDFRDGMRPWVDRQEVPTPYRTPEFEARLLDNDPRALIASGAARPGVEENLPSYTMPCLIYVGDGDSRYAQVQGYIDQIPNVTYVCLPHLDHWAAFYRSDLVLPHVRAFLGQVA